MNKIKILIISVLVILLALLLVFIIHKFLFEKKVVGVIGPTIALNYTNLAPELSRSSMVNDIPDNAVLLLKFYNFNSGQRQWEKSFIIKKGEVKEGEEKSDIILTLDSKYLKGLTNNNFCSVIQIANNNGDLGFETEMSKVSLAWKFKSMYQYRDCFGF